MFLFFVCFLDLIHWTNWLIYYICLYCLIYNHWLRYVHLFLSSFFLYLSLKSLILLLSFLLLIYFSLLLSPFLWFLFLSYYISYSYFALSLYFSPSIYLSLSLSLSIHSFSVLSKFSCFQKYYNCWIYVHVSINPFYCWAGLILKKHNKTYKVFNAF